MPTDNDKVRSFLLAVNGGSEEDTTLELVYRLYQRTYEAEHALWRTQQDAAGLRWFLTEATVSQPASPPPPLVTPLKEAP